MQKAEAQWNSTVEWQSLIIVFRNPTKVAWMQIGPAQETKATTQRRAHVFWTTWPSFGRQPIGLILYDLGLLAEVDQTCFSGLIWLFDCVMEADPTNLPVRVDDINWKSKVWLAPFIALKL
jgi:hypothetical protein